MKPGSAMAALNLEAPRCFWGQSPGSMFQTVADTIKVLTMHASKGLEFPVVALVGAGHMPAPGEDEREEAKLFYVGATRATQRLVIGASGSGKFADHITV